ncbi:MAG: chloride channel protein, partial [Candidatus Dormibacteria bacterium]
WGGRPQWCRPAVGGFALGGLLLALPQLYGIGYPVVDKAVTGQYVLWFLLLLTVAKIAAASLTIGIGGSGGVFGPSLFIGAMGGTAFGVVAEHLFGPAVGSPAIYGLIAMGAVFAAAAQAPLTALASVAEMTGNFTLLLPIMLAVGLAAGVSKRLTYGTIYTTKLLRRGTDIERPRPSSMLQVLTVAEVMQRLSPLDGSASLVVGGGSEARPGRLPTAWAPSGAEITDRQRPQALFANETLEQALRQLVLYGPAGLPVISGDGGSVIGWVTNGDVIRAMADRIGHLQPEVAQASLAAGFAAPNAAERIHAPSLPLDGYELIEVRLTDDGREGERILDDVQLPAGSIPAAVTKGRRTYALRADTGLQAGDRLLVLVPILQAAPPAGGADQPRQLAP